VTDAMIDWRFAERVAANTVWKKKK